MSEGPTATAAEGLRASVPLLVGVVPFGLVAGVAAVKVGLGALGSTAWSVFAFAGAAQLAAYGLIGTGASAAVVVATALVVNARLVLYSVSIAPHLAGLSRWRRLLGAYLLTDQAYVVSLVRFRQGGLDLAGRWRFYLGSGLGLWATWQVSTLAGALLGGALPESVPLGFAVPLAFLALLVPTVTDRPTLVAALVGGTVAVLLAPLGPPALLLAAVCGIAAGAVSTGGASRSPGGAGTGGSVDRPPEGSSVADGTP